MKCPVCCSATGRLFEKRGFWIRGCSACGHRFAEIDSVDNHVQRVYGDSYFLGGGEEYPDYLIEERILVAHGRRYARLLTDYVAPGRVLDVGAAAGFILKGFKECGWRGLGIEPNPRMAEYARKSLGLDVGTGTLEEFRTAERFDLVSMIQVVAHFYDLRKALQVAAEATEPGGHWLIETWNRESLVAKVFGRSWHEYKPPSVLHWFSPDGLEALAAQYGFREVARGRPLKYISSTHAKYVLQRNYGESRALGIAVGALSRAPDWARLPYLGDDPFWALFRNA